MILQKELMKTNGIWIGIVLHVLRVFTSCIKDETLLTPDGEYPALKV
jgi:hypothetical protein